jgi:signal transduction histidine kinase
MRLRLTVFLMSVFASLLVIVAIPLAITIAHGDEQHMFADRLQDAVRMAGVAQQADTSIDTVELDSQLARYSQVYGVSAAIVGRSGVVELQEGAPLNPDDPAVQQALGVAMGGRPSRDDKAIWPWQRVDMVVAVPVLRGDDVVAIVVTVSPSAALRAEVQGKLLTLGAGALATILLSMLLAMLLSRWVLQPVDELAAAAEEIAEGRLNARVGTVDGPPELRLLAGSFDRMAQRVQQMMDHQIAFVADASHQLRTPLATLTLQIENLEAQVDPVRLRGFEALSDEVARLTSILDCLLRLAAVDKVQPVVQEVDVAQLIECRVRTWLPQALARLVSIRLDTGPGADRPVPALIDPTLFSSALDAILDNAIKFSPPQGTVCVRVLLDPSTVRCVVSDNGAGLLDSEFERIGDRFWRSKRHQNVHGTGLGLAIVRVLQEAVGGDLTFAPNTPSGLSVTLSLPRGGGDKCDPHRGRPRPVMTRPGGTAPPGTQDHQVGV